MSAVKLMLTGIFLILVSIFIVAMLILFSTSTTNTADYNFMHGVKIFLPFVIGFGCFLMGLLKKDLKQ